jgi:hypothetical protein
MNAYGDPEERDVQGNPPRDVQGNDEDRNVHGNTPSDVQGNEAPRERDSDSNSRW